MIANKSKIASVEPLRGLARLQVLEVDCGDLESIAPLLGRRLRALATLAIPQHVDCVGLEAEFPSLGRVRHGLETQCLQDDNSRCKATIAELERQNTPELPLRVVSFMHRDAIRDASALARFESLEELTVRFSRPASEDLEWLARLRHLVKLRLIMCGEADDSIDLQVVATLPALREFSIENVGKTTSLAPLQKLDKQLTALRVPHCSDGLDHLALGKFTELRTLDVSRNWLSDLSFVATMPHLEHLEAHRLVDFEGSLAPLQHCKNLQTLCVGQTDGDVTPLAELVALTEFGFAGLLARLQQLVRLEKLELVGFKVDDVYMLRLCEDTAFDLEVLLALPAQRELALTAVQLKDLPLLAQLSQLARLDVSGNGAAKSFAFLRNLTALEYLNVSSTTLRDVSVCAGMSQLKELRIVATAVNDWSSLNHLADLQIFKDGSDGECDDSGEDDDDVLSDEEEDDDEEMDRH